MSTASRQAETQDQAGNKASAKTHATATTIESAEQPVARLPDARHRLKGNR